jgi:hypothetical protein
MRNLMMSFAIIFAAIVNVSAQDTLVTNVRNVVGENFKEYTERIDYKIVIDKDYKKLSFIGKKKNTSFEIDLISLEETISDEFGKIMTFETKGTEKVNIFFEMNELTTISIEKSSTDIVYFLFSNFPNDFPKTK